MRPPMATDHKVEPKLRVLYVNKHAPYNSGEERSLDASVARRLCILGVAVPSPKRPFIEQVDLETGMVVQVEDTMGGWLLSGNEEAARSEFRRAQKEQSGDYAKGLDDEEQRRADEEQRVKDLAEEKESGEKKSGFLKGRKGKDAKTGEARA